MLNKIFKRRKAFSLIEVLVAIFVLGMISIVFINSSTTFITSQQKLVSSDRRDQLADLIISDIMDFAKAANNPYGTVTSTAQTIATGANTIVVTGLSQNPAVGDIFLVNGVRGRYTVESVAGSGANRTITVEEVFPSATLSNGTAITFIALAQNTLTCFNGLNLNNAAPSTTSSCTTVPQNVRDLHNHWRSQIDTELGSDVNIRNIDVESDGLVRVTLGDGTTNTVLAKRVDVCIYDDTQDTVAFSFPGLDEPVQTGIMSGSENITLHYSFRGNAVQQFGNLDSDTGGTTNMTDSCGTVGASTCRQNYSWSNAATVFMYRYTGPDVRIRPSGCNNSVWAGQCNGVRMNNNDLSLVFIFDEYNNTNDTEDQNTLGYTLTGDNGGGFLRFTVNNLPDDARIVVFDDDSESCETALSGGSCTGNFRWRNAHDGMVIHLGTGNINALEDLELRIQQVPFGINQWRVLKPDPAGCLIASDDAGSSHGQEFDQEDMNTCWEYITASQSTTVNAITATSTSVTLNDTDFLPDPPNNMQIGSEYVEYTGLNRTTNVVSGLSRGVRQQGTLGRAITATETIDGSANDNISIGGGVGQPQIAPFGGYAEINGEVFEVDYGDFGNALTNFNNSLMRFRARARNGTTAQAHANGSIVRNWDMRAQDHPVGTVVREGQTNSIPVVMPRVGTSENGSYPRVRVKRRVNLNLSSASICE